MTKPFDAEPRRGPIVRIPGATAWDARGTTIPPSGPADPRQRVRNDRRSPEPYRDLTYSPNLTGTYFERKGRYRLFINHAGAHLECLLTLVVQDRMYHVPRTPSSGAAGPAPLSADERVPFDWGILGYLARPGSRRRDPIAFRFAGDLVGDMYLLRIPFWLGEARIDPSNPGNASYNLGYLRFDGSGGTIHPSFEGWFVDRWPEADVTFGAVGAESSLDTVALRADTNPVLLDRYLARGSVPFGVRTHYWFPPTPQQAKRIGELAQSITSRVVEVDPDGYRLQEGGKKMDLYDLLDAERTLGMVYPDPLYRDNIVTAIDTIVAKIYDEAVTTPITSGGLGLSELPLLRAPLLRIFDAWALSPSHGHGKQSIGTALQRTVDRAGAFATWKHLAEIGIKPRGWRKFRYEVDVQVFKLIEFRDKDLQKDYDNANKIFKKLKAEIEKALARTSKKFAKFKAIAKYLPLTYLVGHVHVKYVGVVEGDEGGPADAPWEASYLLLLGGLQFKRSIGGGGGMSFKMSGPTELWGATPPTPNDLEGVATYSEGGVFGGVRIKTDKGEFDGSLVGAKSMLTFFGSSQEPAVGFFFDAEMSDGSRGAGLSLKGLVGEAILLDSTSSKIPLEPHGEELKEFEQYWARSIPRLAVHFPINGARLPVPTKKEREMMEDEGLLAVKDALNAFAACELPLIANPFAQITLDGYADPPDTPDRNLELSVNRALSVVNYLHSILGDTFTFGISEEQVERDGTHTMGRLHCRGHGEPPGGGGPGRGRQEFDPKERRCDIKVAVRPPTEGSETSFKWTLRLSDRSNTP